MSATWYSTQSRSNSGHSAALRCHVSCGMVVLLSRLISLNGPVWLVLVRTPTYTPTHTHTNKHRYIHCQCLITSSRQNGDHLPSRVWQWSIDEANHTHLSTETVMRATPIGDTPIGDTPMRDTPIGDIPIGDTPTDKPTEAHTPAHKQAQADGLFHYCDCV